MSKHKYLFGNTLRNMNIKEQIKNSLDHIYVFINRLRLKNHGFSLFANDCIGGVMTHNVGEPFNSPTVNLFFERGNFKTRPIFSVEDGFEGCCGRFQRSSPLFSRFSAVKRSFRGIVAPARLKAGGCFQDVSPIFPPCQHSMLQICLAAIATTPNIRWQNTFFQPRTLMFLPS